MRDVGPIVERKNMSNEQNTSGPKCARCSSSLGGIFCEHFDGDSRGERARTVIQGHNRAAICRSQSPTTIGGLSCEENFNRALQRFASVVQIQKCQRTERCLQIVSPRSIFVLQRYRCVTNFCGSVF